MKLSGQCFRSLPYKGLTGSVSDQAGPQEGQRANGNHSQIIRGVDENWSWIVPMRMTPGSDQTKRVQPVKLPAADFMDRAWEQWSDSEEKPSLQDPSRSQGAGSFMSR